MSAGDGLGFFNKPRYNSDVLVGNWFEERALREPVVYTSSKKKEEGVEGVEEGEREGEGGSRPGTGAENTTSGCLETAGCASASGAKYNTTNAVETSRGVSPGDLLRGYYSTTYHRSYGPRPGYIHLYSYPSTNGNPFLKTPTSLQITGSSQVTGSNPRNGNLRDEDCLRCQQLSN